VVVQEVVVGSEEDISVVVEQDAVVTGEVHHQEELVLVVVEGNEVSVVDQEGIHQVAVVEVDSNPVEEVVAVPVALEGHQVSRQGLHLVLPATQTK
jgi:hypothetical protein